MAGKYVLKAAKGGQLFQVNVPSNWTGVASNNAVKFVPQNALGDYQGQSVFTHGVELGVARAASRDLSESTDAFVNALLRGNPGMRVTGQPQAVRISQRSGIGTVLVGRSALNQTERVGVYTTLLADGSLFYYLTVVPDADAQIDDATPRADLPRCINRRRHRVRRTGRCRAAAGARSAAPSGHWG